MTGQTEMVTFETAPERMFVQGVATSLGSGMPGQSLLILQDLTRIRKLELVRRDFVSNVSHELRTPLASLKALTETLHEGALEDPPAARRFLSQMDTEIDNLTQMVRELLELSRIESGRVPFRRNLVDPNAIIQAAVNRMVVQAERAGLKLLYEANDVLPKIRVDAERVEQVLVNLIHNAIKFTPPGGSIHISSSLERGQVVIVVQDTGVGITDTDLPRIFERFYKTDRARSSGGTGLGLSIARHTVEAHGGKIWAESKHGEGSRFYISFPEA
jgi:two-component system phosphate regulon sensor histidine kinase PhoR